MGDVQSSLPEVWCFAFQVWSFDLIFEGKHDKKNIVIGYARVIGEIVVKVYCIWDRFPLLT